MTLDNDADDAPEVPEAEGEDRSIDALLDQGMDLLMETEGDDDEGEAVEVESEDEGEPEGEAAPPIHWSEEDKALLRSLPLDARMTVKGWRKQIEKGAQEKFEAAAEVRREVEEIDQYLAPVAAQMQAQGLTKAQVVGQLLGVFQQIQTDPATALVELASHTRRLATGPGQAEAVARKVAAALGISEGAVQGQAPSSQEQQRVAALEARIMAFEHAQQQAAEQQIHSVGRKVQEFASAKDEQGQAKYPHFEAVRGTMGAVMQAASLSGERLSLEQAYERAVWSHDGLREQLIQARQGQAAKAASAASRSSLARAKGARTPHTRSVDVPNVVDTSIDALLDRGMKEMRF